MIGSKSTELKAIAAILTTDVEELTNAIKALLAEQKETNKLLRDLVDANKDHTHVIENFFAIRKKLDIEAARRREKRELDLEPSAADERY